MSPGRGIALAALCVVGCLGLPGPAGGAVHRLTEGLFLLSDSARPPPDDAPWEPVVLPDSWVESRPGVRGTGWYRFELPPLTDVDGLAGIYLPRLDMNAAVWLDGELVAQCGSFEAPMARCWNRPMYVPLGRLERRPRILEVRLATGLTDGGLGPVLVGPQRVLLPRYDRAWFLRVAVVRHFSGMAVLVAVLMLVFWVGSRDPVYGYFALLLLLWGVASLDHHVRDAPVSHAVWEWTSDSAIDWMAVVGVLVTHRLARLRRPRLERALVAVVALGCATAALVPAAHLHDVLRVTHVGAIGLGIYAAWVLLQGPREHPWARRVAVVATLGAVGVGAHDYFEAVGVLGMDTPRLLALIAPLLTFAFASLLGIRFVNQLERTRLLNRELEGRVQEKHEELLANFERVRQLERERAVTAERQRIMREVHDGMGAQLVSALAMVEGGQSSNAEISDVLRSSIDDMRLVVESLDPDVDDLAMLLGMIRGRIEPRLRRRGLRFDWRVTDLPRVERFGPPQFLNVLRIFQEAVTNTVKHARASVVTVTTGVWPEEGEPRGVLLELCDDGVGLPPDVPAGRGLRNMVRRAWDVGADLRIEKTGQGTRVVLFIPFDPRDLAAGPGEDVEGAERKMG